MEYAFVGSYLSERLPMAESRDIVLGAPLPELEQQLKLKPFPRFRPQLSNG
jgi:hypothetical protein